jgi:branched-chain amino acid transport system substrate-binding protein
VLLLAPLVVAATLSACTLLTPDLQTLTIATILPTSGADARVGQAMQDAVDLAAAQNAAIAPGYRLSVIHVDEAGASADHDIAAAAADGQVKAVVGPGWTQTAGTLLPLVEEQGLATISPTATLPGLTQADPSGAQGLTPAQLHPGGKPTALFRLRRPDDVAGKVAADLAVAPASAHGLAAHSVFLVDDGTTAGQDLAADFATELKAQGGAVAGQASIAANDAASAQSVVTAIVEAAPDLVFFADDTGAGAELRGTLSLTGAPQLPILTVGLIAGDPDWATTVGVVPASAYTTAILPAPDPSALTGAKPFYTAFHAAYPGAVAAPQSALAYDAAMDEIAAIRALLSAGKPVTRAAVLAAVGSASYAGQTGTLAFDRDGNATKPLGFGLYTCDVKGSWHYVEALTA